VAAANATAKANANGAEALKTDPQNAEKPNRDGSVEAR